MKRLVLAVLFTLVASPVWADCVYTGGYPWQSNSCLTAADINAAMANALAPPTSLAPGVAATNLGNASGEVSGPWSALQVARPLPTAAIPKATLTGYGGILRSVAVANQFVTGVNIGGQLTRAQPLITDIGGMAALADDFLVTPSSANLLALLTTKTGTGNSVFSISPAFTGTPTAPTATPGTNTTQLATTAFVAAHVSGAGGSNGDIQINSAGSLAGLTPGSGISTFLATPSSANLRAALTDETGTGVAYFQGGALGTPASGVGTNLTGIPISTGLTGAGTGVLSALAINIGSAGAPVTFNGAGGTPSSLTLTNATGLPVGSITGAGTGVLTFLATPSSANLRASLTDETGTGAAYFQGGDIGTPSAGVGTNITGIPNANVNAVTLASGTSVSLTAPRQYYICTGTCTVTPPVPAAGYEFCIRNTNNVATVITLAALGSSARYENQAGTAYGTAGTGTFVSSGALGDKVCIVGLDSTHYLIGSIQGVWTAN